jgi:hypothetical protein
MPSWPVTLVISALCGVVGIAQLTGGNLIGGTFILGMCALTVLLEVLGIGRGRRR